MVERTMLSVVRLFELESYEEKEVVEIKVKVASVENKVGARKWKAGRKGRGKGTAD